VLDFSPPLEFRKGEANRTLFIFPDYLSPFDSVLIPETLPFLKLLEKLDSDAEFPEPLDVLGRGRPG